MPRLRLLPAERAERKALWAELNRFVIDNDGWIVSQPDAFPVTAEFLPSSPMPDALEDAGWEVRDAGSAERFLPEPEQVCDLNRNKVHRDQLVPVIIRIFTITYRE